MMHRIFNLGLRQQRTPRKPSAPDGHRLYAIGDIHGRLDLLEELNSRIRDDLSQTAAEHVTKIFLGDYVDRGSESRGVIDWLITNSRHNENDIYLRGNHEILLTTYLEDPASFDQWRHLGGFETLVSYGVQGSYRPKSQDIEAMHQRFKELIPGSHHHFLSSLQNFYGFGDYYFVHAGVRPGIPLDQQREEDLLWIRDEFLESRYDFGKVIVHGHTPNEQPEIESNRINIDTGAYLTNRLTCLVLEGQTQRFLQT